MFRRKIAPFVATPILVSYAIRRGGTNTGQSAGFHGQKASHPYSDTTSPGIVGGDRRLALRDEGIPMEDCKEQTPKPEHFVEESEILGYKKPAASWEYDNPKEAIAEATGPDNEPGVYAENPCPHGSRPIEQGANAPPKRSWEKGEPGAPDRSDNINIPEFQTAFGEFERRRSGLPGMDKDYQRQYPKETVERVDIRGWHPSKDHHPIYDYSNQTGKREGFDTSNVALHWDLKRAMKSLYRASLQGLPLVKQYYWVQPSLEEMAKRVKEKFYVNRHVKDPEAIRSLIMLGWTDYTEIITFRKQKGGVVKFFGQSDIAFFQAKHYTQEEGKLLEERRWWEGEEQKKEGPYDGFWSLAGKQNHEEFQKLKGRVPMGWSSSKNYFEIWRCDGTNFWEKNLDYEGWFIKNVDPDRASARKEIQNWVSAGYQQPKHYASKNRRSYRRLVKDMETILSSNSHDLYAASREQLFQYYIREGCPETNRLYAEKKLARQDDEIFTTKYEEYDRCAKQVMREMPNPRLWKTDAFYFRLRYLITPWWEYNWAKAPIGVQQEKAYNEWISNNANYTVYNSAQLEEIKTCKKRNPMAKSWADFYTEYDPDTPDTRRLPWHHSEFDYDKRHLWDERCMRMKKWVASGDIDFKHSFFEAKVFEWEQFVNRPEIVKEAQYLERKYSAPRMVQLYRSLIIRLDIALANQMIAALETANGAKKVQGASEKEISAMLEKYDWSNFNFEVPVVVYPDGGEQPALNLDGTVAAASNVTA